MRRPLQRPLFLREALACRDEYGFVLACDVSILMVIFYPLVAHTTLDLKSLGGYRTSWSWCDHLRSLSPLPIPWRLLT